MIEVTNGASTTSRSPLRMLTDLNEVEAEGNRVKLDDGRWYVDWQLGLHGPIFGYAPRWWRQAVTAAVGRAPITSIRSVDEQRAAEDLAEFYPDVEAVRWMLNGSDPCAAAVKLARAVTGRDKILVYGYHGTASCYASPPAGNDPDDNRLGTMQAERDAYVSLEWLGKLDKTGLARFAAIVVECPPVDGGRDEASRWLWELSDLAHRSDALFILDEVVTGVRYGFGGAAGYYGMHALVDLYAFGKTLGNGTPVAALAGKKEVMDWLAEKPGGGGKVHWSNTFCGDPVALAAVRATLGRLKTHLPWGKLEWLGGMLRYKWNALGLPWKLVGHPTRPVLEPAGLTPELNGLRKFLFARGHIVVDHPWFVCTATTEQDIDGLVRAAGMWRDGKQH